MKWYDHKHGMAYHHTSDEQKRPRWPETVSDAELEYLVRMPEHDLVPVADVTPLLTGLDELLSIVRIHSKTSKDNFAWAELPEASKALSDFRTKYPTGE